MPRTGDSEAILAALSPIQSLALEEASAELGLGEHWHEAPTLAGYFEIMAYARLVDRIHGEGGTLEHARDRAAIRLGLNVEGIEPRLRRQRIRSMCKTHKVDGGGRC